MKKRIFALIMALCLVFALAACGQADTEESHAPAESEEPAGSETPAGTEEPEESEAPEALSAEVTLEEELSTVEEDGVTYMTAQSVAPNVNIEGADEAAQAIASVLAERLTVPQEDIDEYADMAREHYDTLDETERESFGGYSIRYSAEVKRSEGVLSVLCTRTEYTGGAHDNTSVFGLTFDLSTGAQLSAADIAIDYEGLCAKVAESVAAQAEELEEGTITGDLDAYAGGVLDTEKWYLDGEGLVVFAAPDELAPHAAGTIVFTIPYSELEGLLNDSLIVE
ncbi:MAG TPA: DUF3298 domain-containing protein [Candidatus Scatomorpha stercorigallinarum]|nr:DUF3298 domain-containing protein [Candidatus Scatomorpha stercorigallinarum]